jgi:hypothetical protein
MAELQNSGPCTVSCVTSAGYCGSQTDLLTLLLTYWPAVLSSFIYFDHENKIHFCCFFFFSQRVTADSLPLSIVKYTTLHLASNHTELTLFITW